MLVHTGSCMNPGVEMVEILHGWAHTVFEGSIHCEMASQVINWS
jgi:hypothetical protein